MNILDEIKELREKLNALELKASEGVKIKDIFVGEQFVYCEHTYTKLNIENFCIIDDYDERFMHCMFDPMSNNYDESLIRYYINSDRFIEKLGVNKADIKAHYKDDLITLLSREEYEEYRDLIKDYDVWWVTRSACPYNTKYVCNISKNGDIGHSNVNYNYRVRVCFNLDQNTPVYRKGNDEEEFEDGGK